MVVWSTMTKYVWLAPERLVTRSVSAAPELPPVVLATQVRASQAPTLVATERVKTVSK